MYIIYFLLFLNVFYKKKNIYLLLLFIYYNFNLISSYIWFGLV